MVAAGSGRKWGGGEAGQEGVRQNVAGTVQYCSHTQIRHNSSVKFRCPGTVPIMGIVAAGSTMEERLIDALSSPDLATLVLRIVLGTFFVLARFRWIYDPSRPQHWFNRDRHSHLAQRICSCGYGMHPALDGFVALVEVFAGLAVIFGLLTYPALLGLLFVLVFATYCTAREKVMAQNPVDLIDVASDYLWRVEGVYIAIIIALLATGPGQWSFDHVLLAYVG